MKNLTSAPAALNSLAVIGFIALVGAGMWLAVYSAQYVPNVVGSLGTAAVSLSQIFTPAPKPSLSVVPTASTTISFGDTAATSSSSSVASTPLKPVATAPKTGTKTTSVIPLGTTTPMVLSGLPDLTVHIDGIGYLASSTADSFVATSTVPNGSRPALTFTIKNNGTNTANPWRFSASIPTDTQYVYQSSLQQSLNPGDSIQYTLGFDQANRGTGKVVSVTANFDHAITESNFDNNSASATVTILGS